tara:strand:+ start:3725 stop:6640 length:2916 start_codon:yes stop_codon:yes gene_type:complete
MSEFLSIVADGNSSAAKSLRAREQPRDKRGRWVITGAALTAGLRLPDGSSVEIEGKAIGGTATKKGEKNSIRMLVGKGYEQYGIPENSVVEIDSKNGELKSKITLDRNYLESRGIDPDLKSDLPEDLADQPQTLEEMNLEEADDLDIELANSGLSEDEDKERRAERDAEPVAKLSPALAEKVVEGEAVGEIVAPASKTSNDPPSIRPVLKEDYPDRESYMEALRAANDEWMAALKADRAKNPVWEQIRGTTPEDTIVDSVFEDYADGKTPNMEDVIAKLDAAKAIETKQKTAEQLVEGDVIQFPSGKQGIVRKVEQKPGSQGTKLLITLQNEDGKVVVVTGSTSEKLNLVSKPDKANFKKQAKPPRSKPSEDATKVAPVEPAKSPEAPQAKAPQATNEEVKQEVLDFTPPATAAQDNGKEIKRPPKMDDETARQARSEFSAQLDENGKPMMIFDKTGKARPAQDGDEVLAEILDKLPDAKVNKNGEVVIERTKFTDPDGTEYTLTSKVARNNGGGYLLGFEIEDADGNVKELWHYDSRDSYEAIFGKKNGIFRLTDQLAGREMPKESALDLKTYFEPGTLAKRLDFLSGEKTRTIKESTLLAKLDKAKALPEGNVKRLAEVARAEYHLRKFRDEFDSNPDLYTEWYKTQVARFMTLDQLIDRNTSGNAVKLNYSKDQIANVLRSSSDSIYEALVNGDSEDVALRLLALGNTLPTWARNDEIAQNILDIIRKNYKKRYPKENARVLSAITTNAFKSMWDSSEDSMMEKPHSSFDGHVLKNNDIVEFLNNDDKISIGRVRKLSRVEQGSTDNKYEDYVYVEYVDSKGNITTEAIETRSRSLLFVAEGAGTDEDKAAMTLYTPWIRGNEKVIKRLGIAVDENGNPVAGKRVIPIDELKDSETIPDLPENSMSIDSASVGGPYIDKNGSMVGTIVSKKKAKDKSGNSVWAIVYKTDEGDLKKTVVKSGEVRDLKK